MKSIFLCLLLTFHCYNAPSTPPTPPSPPTPIIPLNDQIEELTFMWNKLNRTLQEYPLDDIDGTRSCAKFLEDTLEWWTVFQFNEPDFRNYFNTVKFVDPGRCNSKDREIMETVKQEIEIRIQEVQAMITTSGMTIVSSSKELKWTLLG